jgi:predicted PurR-regulated permease PerM
VALVLIGGLAAVAGTLTLVVTQFVTGAPELTNNAAAGIQQIQSWLRSGPLHLSNSQLSSVVEEAQRWLNSHRSVLTTGALTTATTALEVFASFLLVLFTTFFFLRDGRRIWGFLVRIVPRQAREPLARAGEEAWHTLVSYVRATVLVAFIDAVGIGLALFGLRVSFAFPLAALVFLGAFVPIVGATVSGSVAVLVALVTRGPITALLALIAVIMVQQLEGHVLQPLIMGRAVAIHPLAVIVAIATGIVLAGIMGALVAVPIVAVLNTGVRHLIEHRREPSPDAVVVSANPRN